MGSTFNESSRASVRTPFNARMDAMLQAGLTMRLSGTCSTGTWTSTPGQTLRWTTYLTSARLRYGPNSRVDGLR